MLIRRQESNLLAYTRFVLTSVTVRMFSRSTFQCTLYNALHGVSSFSSQDKILRCDHSDAVLFCGIFHSSSLCGIR